MWKLGIGVRDAGQLREIKYDVDEVHHRLTLRADPKPVPLLAGAYELKGNDLLPSDEDGCFFAAFTDLELSE